LEKSLGALYTKTIFFAAKRKEDGIFFAAKRKEDGGGESKGEAYV
jgi:hypothetical protein